MTEQQLSEYANILYNSPFSYDRTRDFIMEIEREGCTAFETWRRQLIRDGNDPLLRGKTPDQVYDEYLNYQDNPPKEEYPDPETIVTKEQIRDRMIEAKKIK